MDLSKLSIAELHALQGQIQQALQKREQAERAKAREQILEIAQKAGIPLKDLIATAKPRAGKGSVAVRYRHPSNAALQWTGRGRQPKWVQEWVASGQSMDALRV
ncbi:MAG: histidinol phosphate phosphatase [Gallionellales bacterium RBG_16_56_9]|nr:MAG: histidinol phosphate phosphatase [Gallionellales bacterium RBG_16_56_9]